MEENNLNQPNTPQPVVNNPVPPTEESDINKPAGSTDAESTDFLVKRSRKYIIVAVVAFIVLGATAGFLIWKNTKKVTVEPTPTPTIESTPNPDPTVNWKIYDNAEYEFTFKYEPGGTLKEGVNTPEKLFVTINYPDKQIAWSVIENTKNMQLNDLINANGGMYPDPTTPHSETVEASKTFGDLKGTYVISPNAISGPSGSWTSQKFYFQKDKLVFWAVLTTPKVQAIENDQKYFDQILATFKFWKTYTSPDLSVTHTYPSDWKLSEYNVADSSGTFDSKGKRIHWWGVEKPNPEQINTKLQINFSLETVDPDKKPIDFLKCNLNQYGCKTVSIQGQDYLTNANIQDGKTISMNYLAIENSKLLYISVATPNISNEEQNTVDQIINSVSFEAVNK